MFSRYLPPEEDFSPVSLEEAAPPGTEVRSGGAPSGIASGGMPGGAHPNSHSRDRGGAAGELLGGLTRELNRLLGGAFHLEELDTGDILLFLIVLLLFVEGDDVDMAIALGLTLLLSLGEQKSGPSPPADTAPPHPEG